MLSIACLYWNHKHTIALFARVEGTSLSTAHDTSKAPHFGQPKISRSPPPQHAPPPPQPQAHGDTTYLALEEVLVLHLQLRQRFRHGCKQAEEPKNGVGPVGPTVFQVCRATKIFRPAVRSRTLRTGPGSKTGTRCAGGKMSEEQAAAAEPIPEGKEPITLRVRDQVSKTFGNGLTF